MQFIIAGSQFGYSQLFVIFVSNVIAVILQNQCVKLGVAANVDLASASKKHLDWRLNLLLYILAELAVMACDLAEVIGSAIALQLLFGIPLYAGVLITALDVIIILFCWNAKYFRVFEIGIMIIALAIFICLAILVAKSNPHWPDVAYGFLPTKSVFASSDSIMAAVSIVGATVMPNNLYLHSSLVRYRSSRLARNPEESVIGSISSTPLIDELESSTESPTVTEERTIKEDIPRSIRMAAIDTISALTFALFINASILIVSAANFYTAGINNVADLSDAYNLLAKFLGNGMAVVFAIGLLLSGQSSTFTGTLAGQFIMEGFLGSNFNVKPWVRRIVTRLLVIVPALITIIAMGDKGLNDLLVISQVVLSFQLPFAVWPLIYFTCNTKIMSRRYVPNGSSPVTTSPDPDVAERQYETHSFANSNFMTVVCVICAMIVTVLNMALLVTLFMGN